MNYRDIDEIKNFIKVMKEIHDQKGAGSIFRFKKGTKVQITITVEDPELVNAMLISEWGKDKGLMPGMRVEDVRWDDLEGKQVIIDWLKEKLVELERE